jgi:uncharacterized membrane protein YccC
VFGGAAGLTIGLLIHGRGWITVVCLVVVAGVSALVSAISDTGSATGLQLLVYSALGLGPLGAMRPWWEAPLGFAAGAVWAFMLVLPGWLLSPRAAEQRSIASAYRALARELRAVGTAGFADARRGATTALNTAYDQVLTTRSTITGRNQELRHLMAVLNQTHPIAEAAARLWVEGNRPPLVVTDTLDKLADAIQYGTGPPAVPDLWGSSAGALELRNALAGAVRVVLGNWSPDQAVGRPRLSRRARLDLWLDRVLAGRAARIFAVRLMVSIGVAAVVSEVLPLQRSYWVVLTVAIVLKPDFGSVFARAVQRGLGTVVGAVAGAVILALVPYGPWLLLPFGVLAALLPFGRSLNFGLMATFLTPLIVVLMDLLSHTGWQLAEARLVDTLLGCAIVLVVGYAPWPGSWYAHLPGQFASTVRGVCGYMEQALAAEGSEAAGWTGPPDRSRLRRRTYRALSDLRTEFQRTMSEPSAVRRRATAWWPAVVALESVVDAVTATAVAVDHGAPAPSAEGVRQLCAALGSVADSMETGVRLLRGVALPSEEALKPVTDAVRAVLGALSGREAEAGDGAATLS